MAKTERLYGGAILNGDTVETVMLSFQGALTDLAVRAVGQNRQVLYDTLDVSVERTVHDERTYEDLLPTRTATTTTLMVSAEAVLRG